MSASRASRPSSGNLVEVLDRVLDKGVVIDVWARVSLVGIEILTVEARVVIASVDTFLHYAREISKIEQMEDEGSFEELDVQTRDEQEQEAASGGGEGEGEEVEIESEES